MSRRESATRNFFSRKSLPRYSSEMNACSSPAACLSPLDHRWTPSYIQLCTYMTLWLHQFPETIRASMFSYQPLRLQASRAATNQTQNILIILLEAARSAGALFIGISTNAAFQISNQKLKIISKQKETVQHGLNVTVASSGVESRTPSGLHLCSTVLQLWLSRSLFEWCMLLADPFGACISRATKPTIWIENLTMLAKGTQDGEDLYEADDIGSGHMEGGQSLVLRCLCDEMPLCNPPGRCRDWHWDRIQRRIIVPWWLYLPCNLVAVGNSYRATRKRQARSHEPNCNSIATLSERQS